MAYETRSVQAAFVEIEKGEIEIIEVGFDWRVSYVVELRMKHSILVSGLNGVTRVREASIRPSE